MGIYDDCEIGVLKRVELWGLSLDGNENLCLVLLVETEVYLNHFSTFIIIIRKIKIKIRENGLL
jgi:hypothetical protein